MNDASMAAGEGVIRVRILDPRADEASMKQEEYRTFEKFDALIKTGNLHPLEKLVETIV